MAVANDPTTSKVSTAKNNGPRQLNGTSFLTLEHVGYFVLVVLLPVVLFCGAMTAIQLWSGQPTILAPVADMALRSSWPLTYSFNPSVAIGTVAMLLVLAPLMYALRRRTMSEYAKRPGYTDRVGYKLPVYSALAVLAACTLGAFIQMLSIFLQSLVQIGVSGSDIGRLYTSEFLPALLALAIFGMATWYVLWFAKGKDLSRQFVMLMGLLAGILAVALFVTTLTLNHQGNSKSVPAFPAEPTPLYDNYPSKY